MTQPARRDIALLALAGGAAALGQAPVGAWPVSIVALGWVLAAFARAPSLWPAVLRIWVSGTAYFAVALFWLVEPFLVDVARHGWMAPFALALMAGGLALFWGAAGAVGFWLGQGSRARLVFALAMTLTLAELARGYLFTGFPWAMIGHIWIDTAALGVAGLVGPAGLTLLTLLAAAGAGLAIATRRVGWAIAAIVPVGVVLGAGFVLRSPAAGPVSDAPVVRLVQPNAEQHLKWDPDHALTFFRRQLDYSAAASDRRPDLIVWPESSIPWVLSQADEALAVMAAASDGVPLAFGVNRREGARAYNALAVLEPGAELGHIYDKHHLVPFGEYIPFGGVTRALGLRSFAARDGFGYSPGPGAAVLDLGELGTVLPLICYEAIFPQDVRAAPARPDWILQVTNDAWFGKVSGPYQHLAQARLRAAEQGLPLVRVANTGVSAVIDAWGRIEAEIPLGVAGWIDHPIPAGRPPTFYATTGDWPVFLILLAGLALLHSLRRGFSD